MPKKQQPKRLLSSSVVLLTLSAFSVSLVLIAIEGGIATAEASYPTLPVGSYPEGIAFDSANGNLYVTNKNDNTVSAISGQTNTVIGSPIPVGSDPSWVAVDPAKGNLYVANFGSNTVSIIATTVHPTALTLNTIASVPSGTTVTVTGNLADVSTNSPLSRATITFTGTGATNIRIVVTASDGTFSTTGAAPKTVANGWTVQAHYAGEGIHGSSNSATKMYNTN